MGDLFRLDRGFRAEASLEKDYTHEARWIGYVYYHDLNDHGRCGDQMLLWDSPKCSVTLKSYEISTAQKFCVLFSSKQTF